MHNDAKGEEAYVVRRKPLEKVSSERNGERRDHHASSEAQRVTEMLARYVQINEEFLLITQTRVLEKICREKKFEKPGVY